jgi:hypothetical protein
VVVELVEVDEVVVVDVELEADVTTEAEDVAGVGVEVMAADVVVVRIVVEGMGGTIETPLEEMS